MGTRGATAITYDIGFNFDDIYILRYKIERIEKEEGDGCRLRCDVAQVIINLVREEVDYLQNIIGSENTSVFCKCGCVLSKMQIRTIDAEGAVHIISCRGNIA